jgi:hypothetical protein
MGQGMSKLIKYITKGGAKKHAEKDIELSNLKTKY